MELNSFFRTRVVISDLEFETAVLGYDFFLQEEVTARRVSNDYANKHCIRP
ncbi:MAG TPA: hypothetical protein PK263_05845 [bacterium]|nr:hypothetical protein [bacterium]